MLDLRDYKRQRQAEVLRRHLLATDPKARQQAEASQQARAADRERRLANAKAAEALQFSVGDTVTVRRHRDRLDGKQGTVLGIRPTPSGRRLIDVGFQVQRRHGLAPYVQSIAVDAELLRRVDAKAS